MFSTSIILRYCYTGFDAGGFYVSNAAYTEQNSQFLYLAGQHGGAVHMDNGNLIMSGTTLNNMKAYRGGAIYLKNRV